ncbi:hypothetical protein BSL78_20605 [Apostichopus japonicus]|uniref:Uncharacterized protein n=1 Tax=Stichopus japonicus TaxID=307972 RepID=A0A2G8K3J9_STIJA|nr:hypothetical protein BSL78_20605 [Apostichopus japonicus]
MLNMALMKSAIALCTFLVLFDAAAAVIDCSGLNIPATTTCKDYVAYGAADVAVERIALNRFSDDDQEIFRVVLANISNKYYPSIKIEPQNVAIVELFENREGVLILSFFIMNPSGSEYFPILFRTKELHLLMELNMDAINDRLPYTIEARPPEDDYPLFFPVWAIVIIVYLVIVLIVFLIVLASRNWKLDLIPFDLKQKADNCRPVTRKVATDPNQNDYDIVKKNNTQDGAMQTPRTVAMQVRPSDIDKTTAVIETQPDAISKEPDATSSGSDTSKMRALLMMLMKVSMAETK